MTVARRFKIALMAIVAVAAAPFALIVLADLVAAALGCELNEGDIHPCAVMGLDLGYLLYATALTGVIMFIVLPFAGAALLIWLILAGIAWLAGRRRRKTEPA